MTISCSHCGNPSLVIINAKCSDKCYIKYQDMEYEGYVPLGLNIGGGDYLSIAYCHVCGKASPNSLSTEKVTEILTQAGGKHAR